MKAASVPDLPVGGVTGGLPGVHSSGRHRRAEPFAPRDGGMRGGGLAVGMVRPGGGAAVGAQGGRVTGAGFRARTVRAKIVALLMVPVVALMAMWGLAAVTVVTDGLIVQQVSVIQKQIQDPVARTVSALQLERAAVVRYLAAPAGGATPTGSAAASAATTILGPSQASTNAAVAAVRTGFQAAHVQIAALDPLQSDVHAVTADFDGLAGVRDRVAARQIPTIDAYDAYTGVIEDLRSVETNLASVRAAHTASTGTMLAAAVGLLAIFVSLLMSVRIGRGLVVELVGLRNAALDLAGRRLPAAIARLRAGQEVDLAAEAPAPLPGSHGDDEVGQVAEALAVVQRAALEAAVERAEVVSGVAGVFLNLARRSQTLVHRQLALLETMERRVDDPAELEDLFRLDHLATRMRRHAEGLIILSGSPPGRGWRHPVPLMDVLRAAAAEVEDFARVDVRRMPPVAVSGGAVADLTHLVAELVENATAFSPPHSRVVVRGELIDGGGCLIEVEDRGLGMSGPALADANRRIADARPDDLFESDRLGLYVVSRLARRHGVEVVLRPGIGDADGGRQRGTVAVLVVPPALLTEAGAADGGADGDGRAPGGDGDVGVGSGRDAGVGVGVGVGVGIDAGVGVTSANGKSRSAAATRSLGDHGFQGPATGASQNLDDPGWSPPTPPHAPPPSQEYPEPQDPDDQPLPPGPVGVNGLPRRIRQASLAAQLRDRDPASRNADPAGGPAPTRSPDTVRATMSALQQGWTRGRGPAAMEDM